MCIRDRSLPRKENKIECIVHKKKWKDRRAKEVLMEISFLYIAHTLRWFLSRNDFFCEKEKRTRGKLFFLQDSRVLIRMSDAIGNGHLVKGDSYFYTWCSISANIVYLQATGEVRSFLHGALPHYLKSTLFFSPFKRLDRLSSLKPTKSTKWERKL